VGRSFSQNYKSLNDYYQAIDANSHAIEKGLQLTQDDVIRAEVIKQLMCNFKLNKASINQKFNIDFDEYFAYEISSLTVFVKDKLIDVNEEVIRVKPIAKLLIRNICMTFDVYLQKQLNKQRFSRVI
jgi:oxygen-independent coproporphyrinogen-3 oxidase